MNQLTAKEYGRAFAKIADYLAVAHMPHWLRMHWCDVLVARCEANEAFTHKTPYADGLRAFVEVIRGVGFMCGKQSVTHAIIKQDLSHAANMLRGYCDMGNEAGKGFQEVDNIPF